MNTRKRKGRKVPIKVHEFTQEHGAGDPHCVQPIDHVFKKTRRKGHAKRRTPRKH